MRQLVLMRPCAILPFSSPLFFSFPPLSAHCNDALSLLPPPVWPPLIFSPVRFLDVEGPLRVEQRKELLLPTVVFLCGEKDAAKVVAAKEREGERGVKAVQSFSWDNPLMHVMQQVQAVRGILMGGNW